jgi:hypothetical protein
VRQGSTSAALVALGVGLFSGGCSSDPPPSSGDVVIETTADATNAPEIVGTLRVVEGSDVLGCESATTERTATPEDPEGRPVDVFTATCDSGSRQGTFDVTYLVDGPDPGVDTEDAGSWEIVDTTGDFAGLTGNGTFTVDYSEQDNPGEMIGAVSYQD